MEGGGGATAAVSYNATPVADGIKEVPSVRETVDTSVWLSNVLQRDLQRDVDADDEQGRALRSADIDVSPARIVSERELLRGKVKEAVVYWDKLAERIPLKRQRPAGYVGQMAGSDEMFLDYDIDETTVPPEPPDEAKANEVHLYQYYVQRLISTVPRANMLQGHTKEGPVPLRARRVKTILDILRNKRAVGDTPLLKEKNYVTQFLHIAKQQTADAAAAAADALGEEALVSPSNSAGNVASHGGVGGGGDAAAVRGWNGAAAGARRTVPEGGSTRTGPGGPADGAQGGAAATSAPLATPSSARPAAKERTLRSFSGPCRTVVTFALHRSVSKGKAMRTPGRMRERRLFEVEALEHNTLQEIMEAMPPCLADRILEEKRRAARSDDGGSSEAASSSAVVSNQKRMSLGGGFLLIRGVFYVTKPLPGEDMSLVTPPPPPPSPPKPRKPPQKAGPGRKKREGPTREELRAIARKKKALIREEKERAKARRGGGRASPRVRTRGGKASSGRVTTA
ncbi:unnamed protein product, partial [Scytosiphon promiscuus]